MWGCGPSSPQEDVHFLAMHKALTLLQSNVYYSGKCKDRADTRNWYYSVLGQERWPRLVMCQQGALICIFAGSEWNRPGQDGKQAKLGTTSAETNCGVAFTASIQT